VTDFGAYLWGLSFLQLLCHKLHRKDILVWAHEERANAASDEVRCVRPIPASAQLVKTILYNGRDHLRPWPSSLQASAVWFKMDYVV
jgi:hypothetical protein